MKHVNYFIICMMLNIGWISAQETITVNGQINDTEDNPLAYAVISVNSENTYADENGKFSLTLTKTDSYRVEIDLLGYQPVKTIYHREEELQILNIRLIPEPVLMEEILVQGRKRQWIPQSDIIRDRSEETNIARNVGDIFRDVPGFGIIKRGGYALDPVFRSFKGEQLNLIYDGGIQLTHACPNRMDPATTHVTPEEIEKVEMIRGPFSVRFGPTMGGVVNIITETPGRNGDGSLGGSLETSYETNGNAKVGRISLHGGDEHYDFLLNAGLKDFEDYSTGNNTEIPSSFKSYDYSLKSGFNLSEKQRIQLNWRQSFGRDILHAALPMDTEEDNTSVLSLDYTIRDLGPKVHHLKIKGYVSRIDHLMTNRLRPNFMMMEAVSDVQATTAGGRVELNLSSSPKAIWYMGIDYRYRARKGVRNRLIKRDLMTGEELEEPMSFTDQIWQDAAVQNAGLFGEGRLFPSDHWTLVGGFRFDYNHAILRDPDEDFRDMYAPFATIEECSISGTASATFHPSDQWALQWAVGRGVRSANMAERYINHFQIGMDPYEYVGDPGLHPEINYQSELSASWNIKKVRLSVNVFYSYIKNYITAAVDQDLPRKYMPLMEPHFAKRFQNIDAAQTGFEFNAGYSFLSHWTLSGSIAYTWAKNLDWDEPLPEIPPMEAHLAIKYKRERWWAGVQARFVEEQDRISVSFDETTTSGFSVFDFRAGIEPIDHLTIGVSVLNIFDRYYYEHLSRSFRNMPEPGVVYEAGRNLTFFVKYSF